MEKLVITVKSAVDHPMPDARIYVAYVDEITTRGLINEILPLSGVIELAVEPDRALVVRIRGVGWCPFQVPCVVPEGVGAHHLPVTLHEDKYFANPRSRVEGLLGLLGLK
jgi:hypothetical protein